MRSTLTRLERAAAAQDVDGYLALRWEFYGTCYRASGRSRLVAEVERLYRRSERYNRLVLSTAERFQESLDRYSDFFATARRTTGSPPSAASTTACAGRSRALRPGCPPRPSSRDRRGPGAPGRPRGGARRGGACLGRRLGARPPREPTSPFTGPGAPTSSSTRPRRRTSRGSSRWRTSGAWP